MTEATTSSEIIDGERAARGTIAHAWQAFVDRILPPYAAAGSSALDHWRLRTLRQVLAIALSASTVPLVILVALRPNGSSPMMAVDLILYAMLLWAGRSRRLGYRHRVRILVGVLFVIGAASMILVGFRGAGIAWVGVSTVLAAILLGATAALTLAALMFVVASAVAVGIALDLVPWAAAMPGAFGYFIVSAFSVTMLFGLVSTASASMMRGLVSEHEARVRAESDRRRGQRLEALGTLAGGVAHDFNNLLAPLMANLELLDPRATGVTTADREAAVADMRLAAERGRSMVRDLLALSRGDRTEETLVDVAVVVEEVTRLIRSVADPRVVVDVHTESAPRVRASASDVHHVLMNLALNAVQAMPEGGTLTIALSHETHAHAADVVVMVRDSGVGMDSDTMARCFDPFFTTKRSSGGAGMGLATVHAAVTRMSGRISVTSTPGKGTSVRVALPGVPSSAADTRTVDSAIPATTAPAPHRVLVVDDDALVRVGTQRMLAALGHDVDIAASGVDALRWLEAHRVQPTLLITDHRMPGMDGAELTRAVRDRHPDVPIIIASGYIEEAEAALDDLRLDVVLLPKPFARRELVDALAAAPQRLERSVSSAAVA
jgi:signal transduction histidine kinase/ActR/RegA family two-component response regulator